MTDALDTVAGQAVKPPWFVRSGDGDDETRSALKDFINKIGPDDSGFFVVMSKDANGEMNAESFVLNDFTEAHAAMVDNVLDDYLPEDETLEKPQG